MKISTDEYKSQLVGNSYYKKTAENYLEIRSNSKEWKSEQEIFKNLINEFPDKISVLDIPFGTGRFVNQYLEKDIDIFGLEISTAMLEAAKKSLGTQFSRCNITIGDATNTLPFKDNSIDLVVCFRFIKFLSYTGARDLLCEFNRVSRSSVIILTNVLEPTKNENSSSKEYLNNLNHIGGKLYENDLTQMFNEVGFVVEKIFNVDLDTSFKKQTTISEDLTTFFLKLIKHIKNGSLISALEKRSKKIKEEKKNLKTQILLLKKESANR